MTEGLEVLADQVRRVEKLLTPRTYFLSHDEIGVAQLERAGAELRQVGRSGVGRQCARYCSINWNHGQAAKSLAFFGRGGQEQVLAGYYDGPVDNIRPGCRSAGRAVTIGFRLSIARVGQ